MRAALDQLSSYYDLDPGGMRDWGASPSHRRGRSSGGPGEVEMGMIDSAAGERMDAAGDDRVRLRGRRGNDASDLHGVLSPAFTPLGAWYPTSARTAARAGTCELLILLSSLLIL